MEKFNNKTNLEVPKIRKSIDVIKHIKKLQQDAFLSPMSSPQATSTVERRGCESLIDNHYLADFDIRHNIRNNVGDSCDSSLGILDIDNCKGLGDDASQKSTFQYKSLSFNPGEISARSTEDFKENVKPDDVNLRKNENIPKSLSNTSSIVNDILEKAKIQSDKVDMILRTSIDPNALKMRESLHSYKQSLSGANQISNEKKSWNFRADDFGDVSNSQTANDSYFRESMFPSSKFNMTKEENSWMKDHGIIPVNQNLSLMSGADLENGISSLQLIDKKNADNWSDTTNLASTSKMSVGYYFEERCKNNINNILTAPSPEKKIPHPPLYDPSESLKSRINNSSKTYTVNGFEFTRSNVKNDIEDNSLTPDACKNLSEFTNIDDTISSTAMSLTQIRNMMGNMNAERPSVLLDQMLGVKNKKDERNYNMKTPKKDDKKNFMDHTCDGSTSSFIHSSNIFHSTKNDDFPTNTKKNNKNILESKMDYKNYISANAKFSPISDNSMPSKLSSTCDDKTLTKNETTDSHLRKSSNQTNFTREQSVSPSSSFRDATDNSSKTLRKFTTCSSSGLTDNTVKSVNTVIAAKISSCLNPIIENSTTESYSDDNDKTLNKNDNKNRSLADMSPGILSISQDRIHNSIMLTPSDVSKELKDLMSPMSCNDEKEFNTPASGRHVRRLMDRYQHVKSPVSNSAGWVSPTQTRINNISKECIPAQTPYRMENKAQSPFEGLINDDYEQMNVSNVAEHSLNVPTLGDWIKIESVEEDLLVGINHNFKLRIESLSSRWISLKFAIHSVYVNDQLFDEDIKNVIVLQAPTSKILIKADSKTECSLRLVALKADVNVKIKIIANLIDIVTKCTSVVEHEIKIQSKSPKLSIQSVDSNMINHLEFPTIPEQCESYLPFILWNESSEDLPIRFEIKCNAADVYKIINVATILEEETNNITPDKTADSAFIKDEIFSLPHGRKSALMILVQYFSPKLENSDVTIQQIDATLNVYLVSNHNQNNICIQSIPVYGTVGISSLLIRNSQRSDTLILHHGSTEDIEVYNAGSITSEYKIFVASYSDRNGQCATIVPCSNTPLFLNKSVIILHPGEKNSVQITYPSGDTTAEGFSKLLAFESRYTTEVIDVIGIVGGARCQSQQSACSMESVSTRTQETLIKSTKKEMSWGSVKLGDAKVQDITFKNVSASRKLRAVVSVIGDGFKVHSDTGKATSMVFTLQPQECRALHVEFRPSHIGGHTGMLRITRRHSPSSNPDDIAKSKTLFRIPLHAVGGHSTFIFRDGVFRHAGSQGLPLGSLVDSGLTKEIHFTIWNKGTVRGFVMFNIDLKWKYRALGNEVCVTPQQIVIQPGASTRCTVSIPRRALLLAGGQPGDTEVVAALTVFHGDETTRLRIKKICKESNNSDILESWSVYSQGKLKKLCERFRDEDLNYGGITAFKETSAVLKSLLDELQQKEVMLTYDMDLDCSVTRTSNDLDETLQFHTICEDDPANNTIVSDIQIG